VKTKLYFPIRKKKYTYNAFQDVTVMKAMDIKSNLFKVFVPKWKNKQESYYDYLVIGEENPSQIVQEVRWTREPGCVGQRGVKSLENLLPRIELRSYSQWAMN